MMIKLEIIYNIETLFALEDLREVEATLLDQWVDEAVHDGHQSQNQNGIKSLGKTERKDVNSSTRTAAAEST